MVKVMILDDEALPRIALRNIVEKKYSVVGTVASAAEAMELAVQTMPDIILVDIILPDMNGLEFIRNIAVRLPMTKYIVISNVDTTEYLKTALRLDVFDYLAKDSLSEEALLDTIDRLSKKICRERASGIPEETEAVPGGDRHLLWECLNGVLDGKTVENGAVRQVLDSFGLRFYSGMYCCIVLKEERQEQVQYSNSILNLFREILFDSGEGIVLLRPSYNYVCFFGVYGNTQEVLNEVRLFAKRCITSVKKSFGLDFSAGISSFYSLEDHLFCSYQEAKKAYDYHFYTGVNSINYFMEVYARDFRGDENIRELVSSTLSISAPEEIGKIREAVRRIMELSEKDGISRERVLGIYLDLIHHAAFLLRKSNIDIGDHFNEMTAAMTHCGTLKQLSIDAVKLLDWLEGILQNRSREDMLIQKIRGYVYTHLDGELSLDSISEKVHLSPAYLGQYFKRNTGEKLKTFIMNARIETAKGYLTEGRKAKEIALLTGFSTESYFIQCFKATTGMTPNSYYRHYIKKQPDDGM